MGNSGSDPRIPKPNNGNLVYNIYHAGKRIQPN